jgi:hypothetical protein
MQLKKPKPIREALTLATCTMLSTVPTAANALGTDSPWEIDTALMYYSETDRVSAVEPVVSGRKELGDDEYLNLRLVVDVLTGSSANGAIPTSSPQTFTQPSGNSVYTTNPNEAPLDPSFLDTRVALSGEWEKAINDRLKGVYSANLSTEYDYISFGLGTTFAKDNDDKSRTFTLGLAANFDSIDPVGGVPKGLTVMPVTAPSSKTTEGGTDSKTVVDLLFGVTQIINRKTLMQLNYVLGSDSGYMTDPYKIISVVDITGALLGANQYIYEKRPDSRQRNAIFWKGKHQFTNDVIDLSYRYYWDDWEITSHTLDMHYRYEINEKHYLQPHVRYYTQSAADFYKTSLRDTQVAQTQFVSADYRLADMTTTTVGLKYGMKLAEDSEFGVRLELMQQSADPSEVIGVQQGQDLTPDVDAVIFQINYSLLF